MWIALLIAASLLLTALVGGFAFVAMKRFDPFDFLDGPSAYPKTALWTVSRPSHPADRRSPNAGETFGRRFRRGSGDPRRARFSDML
jgi:hypothetical protein